MKGSQINKIYIAYIDNGNDKDLLKIAKSYAGFIVSRSRISEDLYCDNDMAMSYAAEGLTEAINRYDKSKNCSFATFLHYRMLLKAIYARNFLEHSIASVNFSRYSPDDNYYDTEDQLSEQYFRMDYHLEAKNYDEELYVKYLEGEITIDNLTYWVNEYLDKEEISYTEEYLKENNSINSKKSKQFKQILQNLKVEIEKY